MAAHQRAGGGGEGQHAERAVVDGGPQPRRWLQPQPLRVHRRRKGAQLRVPCVRRVLWDLGYNAILVDMTACYLTRRK